MDAQMTTTPLQTVVVELQDGATQDDLQAAIERAGCVKQVVFLGPGSLVEADDDERDQSVNMDRIAEMVQAEGVHAAVAQTGGNVATIYAGRIDRDGTHAVAAGPGTYGYEGEPSLGDVGPEAEAEPDAYWYADGRSTERSIAAEIVRRARVANSG